MNLSDFFTPEIQQGIRIFVTILALFHVLVGVILFRFTLAASSTISTPGNKFIRGVSLLHITVLVGILIFVILF